MNPAVVQTITKIGTAIVVFFGGLKGKEAYRKLVEFIKKKK